MRSFRVLGLVLFGFVVMSLAGCSGGSNTVAGTFTLSVSPASVTLQLGGSAQFTLTATPSGNYTTPVNLQTTGLPAGVTLSPSILALTPGTPLTVTLTASSSAKAGAATLVLNALGSSQSATVALTVTPAPSFGLNITSPSNIITAGGIGQPFTFSVQPSNGFTGTVAVTLSGLGNGVTASTGNTFNVITGATQVVTLTAAPTAGVGLLFLQVVGTSVPPAVPFTSTTVLNLAVAQTTGADVTTYHYDNTRQGWNSHEPLLTPANVNATSFGLRHLYPVDGKVDAQPLYVGGLTFPLTNGGTQTDNFLYVATENDTVYALSAATGTQYWKTSVLGASETPSDSRNCGQVVPVIGITSTPVIDRAYGTNGAIFVVGMSKDAGGGYHQRLHALDLLTGAELPGSPTEITASFPGNGAGSSHGTVPFDPAQYEERAGLLLLNGTIYTAWTSHCDIPPYTGWAMGYSEASLKQTSVINLTPNGSDGAIWMSGYGPAADTAGNIFFVDGNGTLDPGFNSNGFPSQGDFGNAIVKLSTSNGLSVSDFWEPYNTVAESNADIDLGSGGAMLLPDLTDKSGAVRHLVVAAGKDTNIYVADRDNLGKFSGGSSNSTLYQELPGALPNGDWAGPAYFNNTVFYGGVNDTLKAYALSNAMLSTAPTSQSATKFAYPGATPSVSSNGNQNGIVWALESPENASAVLHAYDATNLQHELYNSKQAANARDAFGNGNKFLTPVVTNGMVFVGTPNAVAVFGLLQ